MSGLLSGVRSAWRLMGRYRSASIFILITLTLGLGANVAIFTIARGVVFRPLAPAVRSIVASIDPMQPISNATTLDRVVSDSIADRRFFALATVAFAVISLLLSAAGLYGVTSYSISARTREIGVRVALGAEPGRLARLLTAQSLRPVIAGLVFGLGAAFLGQPAD